MPYADRQRQLAYNREWAKRNRGSAATSPLCDDIFEALRFHGKALSRKEILDAIEFDTTLGTVSVALNRMKEGGRIQKLGSYRNAKWRIAAEARRSI